ncbi:MAG: hypothetical protein QM572_05275 [Nocardioides sp.]|uniref:hypothetical protein n=1 Tax=Nocardioides sp. TaxID=35761 RepID=UPI0039E37B34
MEILLWLVPPVVVTTAVGLWAAWRGRERPEMSAEEAARRMGEAMARPARRR